MSTIPGRRPERLTGSNNNPVTDPPSGRLKEMALISTPLFVDSLAFCRFGVALTTEANRFRSAAVAAPPKSGRATAQEFPTGLGPVGVVFGPAGDDPAHAEINTTTSVIAGFMKRQPTQ